MLFDSAESHDWNGTGSREDLWFDNTILFIHPFTRLPSCKILANFWRKVQIKYFHNNKFLDDRLYFKNMQKFSYKFQSWQRKRDQHFWDDSSLEVGRFVFLHTKFSNFISCLSEICLEVERNIFHTTGLSSPPNPPPTADNNVSRSTKEIESVFHFSHTADVCFRKSPNI